MLRELSAYWCRRLGTGRKSQCPVHLMGIRLDQRLLLESNSPQRPNEESLRRRQQTKAKQLAVRVFRVPQLAEWQPMTCAEHGYRVSSAKAIAVFSGLYT